MKVVTEKEAANLLRSYVLGKGGPTAAAKVLGLTRQHIYKMQDGAPIEASAVLKALGIKRVLVKDGK